MIRIMVQWHAKIWLFLSTSSCNWVKTIRKDGSSRSGRQTRTPYILPSRTPEEELRDKIAELERRNLDLQMENDLLKKSENWKGEIAIFNS